MVPAYLSEPPKAPKAASLLQLEDNTGKWAGYSGPVEKTWVRGTTNNAMVPAYLSEPPKPAKKSLL